MNFSQKNMRYLHRVFLVALILMLVACSDSGPNAVIGVYGKSINYLENASIDYPDFSLHFLEKKVSEAGTSKQKVTYLFQLAAGTHQQQIEWHDVSYKMSSYDQFLYKGQKFALDIKSSDFLDRELDDGELIVWTQPQYEQFKYNKSQVRDEKLRKFIAPAVEDSLLQQRKTAGLPLFELYKEYHQALDMVEPDNVADFLSEENPVARAKQVESLLSSHIPSLKMLILNDAFISVDNAKLYISGVSANGGQLIGVTFIKRQDAWKIVNVKVMPDDTAGKAWIKYFMHLKQDV